MATAKKKKGVRFFLLVLLSIALPLVLTFFAVAVGAVSAYYFGDFISRLIFKEEISNVMGRMSSSDSSNGGGDVIILVSKCSKGKRIFKQTMKYVAFVLMVLTWLFLAFVVGSILLVTLCVPASIYYIYSLVRVGLYWRKRHIM